MGKRYSVSIVAREFNTSFFIKDVYIDVAIKRDNDEAPTYLKVIDEDKSTHIFNWDYIWSIHVIEVDDEGNPQT